MEILIDTDILIDISKGKEELRENYVISITTLLEFLFGVKNEEEFKEKIEDSIKVLPLDNKVILVASKIYKELKRNPIDVRDLLIGATAIAYRIPLKTRNKKHFERLKEFGLKLV